MTILSNFFFKKITFVNDINTMLRPRKTIDEKIVLPVEQLHAMLFLYIHNLSNLVCSRSNKKTKSQI